MSKTLAEHSAAYRTRRAAKLARYEAALREIIDILKDNAKPLAEKVRATAQSALNPGEPQ